MWCVTGCLVTECGQTEPTAVVIECQNVGVSKYRTTFNAALLGKELSMCLIAVPEIMDATVIGEMRSRSSPNKGGK